MKRITPIITCFVISLLILGCSEDNIPTTDNIGASSEIRLNTLFKINEVQDGFIVSGIKDSKLTIIKLDVNFNIVWTRNNFDWGNIYHEDVWGGSFYSIDIVNIIENDNGNLICFCSIMQGTDVFWPSTKIVILDKLGKELRSKDLEEYALINATTTSDGGYLLFGNSLIKLDSDLSKISENKDLDYETSGANITQTDDNCIAVTGTWNSNQVYLQKLDKNGNKQWENKSYNQIPFNDLGYDIHQMSNNDYVIIGRTRNLKEPWDMDCFMIRTTNNGDTIWTKKFGLESDEWLEKFIYASDNDFIIKETIDLPGNSNRRANLLKISGSGEIVKSKEINNSDEYIYTSSGYFLKAKIMEDSILSLTKVQFDNILNE